MRCQYEDYYDDMYPEFAPDPIVVRCERQATHHFVIAEDAADEGGYPKRGVRETVHQWLCTEHTEGAELWPSPFNPVLLRTEVTA